MNFRGGIDKDFLIHCYHRFHAECSLSVKLCDVEVLTRDVIFKLSLPICCSDGDGTPV